jgi:cytochrome c-type biogenesis protein
MNLVDIGVALVAGLISITSPCCLPLLPGYLGYLSGMSVTEMGAGRRRPTVAAVLFVAGFTAVFAGLGATASALGGTILQHRHGLEQIAGAFILALGLLMLASSRLSVLATGGDWSQRWARGQLWAAAPLGAAFAITWTPCIGPVLAGILTLAASTEQVGQGVLLLVVYSIGLGLPFIALSFSVPRVRAWLSRTRRAVGVIRAASGTLLVAMGVLLLTDRWLPLMAPVLRLYAKAQWPPV